jgi:hypothetical protein
MARPTANATLTKALKRLGMPADDKRTSQVYVGGHNLTGSRVEIAGLPFLMFQGAHAGSNYDRAVYRNKLIAALMGRLPAVGVIRDEELLYVRMPGWAFAALLRMALRCPPEEVETALSTYLPLAGSIPETDRLVGSGILSALDEAARSLSSTSSTD